MPTVTYVIPAFDSERTIGTAVLSALRQTGVDIEVVVVDDASRDGTVDVVRNLDDDRVRLLECEVNQGPAAARNIGLAAARGEWVGVLDSDDALEHDRTARMIARATDAGAAVVVDNLLVVASGSGQEEVMFTGGAFDSPGVLDLAAFIDGNIMLDRSIDYALGYLKPIIRRDLVTQHGLRYRENVRIGEDFYFLSEALVLAGPAATVPHPGYRYHTRDGSISSRLSIRDVAAMQAAQAHFADNHELGDAAEAYARRTRSLAEVRAFLELTESARNRNWRQAWRVARDRPSALRHLTIPLRAKVGRVADRYRRR